MNPSDTPPAGRPGTRIVAGPFNRVEGDLEVTLDIEHGRVARAQVSAPMYRGFEQILLGKAPRDAMVIVPRICGICSVTQSVAAARALAACAGLTPPHNGVLATELILATENLADHLAHFYLFFMPDFTRAAYAERPWFGEAQRRFAAQRGEHVRRALAARQRWLTMLGLLAGKWPHTLTIEPGGSARPLDAGERTRLAAKLRELRVFLEDQFFGARLEEVGALADEPALWRWVDAAPGRGDLRLFLALSRELELDRAGCGPGRYLCYGAYPDAEGRLTAPPGVWRAEDRRLHALDTAAIHEDLSHAWMAAPPGAQRHGGDAGVALHPREGHTEPLPDKPGAYTWNKAPRLAGEVVETGAIARQLAAAQPVVASAVARHGGNVTTRVLARALELATTLPLMEQWLRALQPGAPWCHATELPPSAQGVGLVEAARGALGHWLRVDGGRIANYQIVAPTSWNFSPRDAAGNAGALEAALVGTPIEPGEDMPVRVQHIVRSFDPCMVCTVH